MTTFRLWCFVAASTFALTTTASASILYVDDDAPRSGNGQTWKTAYRFLQDALAAAAQPGSGITEIRIAQGVYKPDRNEAAPNGTGNRMTWFHLQNGRAIRGGFAGLGASNPDMQDFELYPSVLSGDLNGNDGPNFANNTENSFHVLYGTNLGSATLIEGLTIRGGRASGGADFTLRFGAGMFLNASSPLIQDCAFESNMAADPNNNGSGDGGGLRVLGGNPRVWRCRFSGNLAGYGGAAGFTDNSSFELMSCEFSNNIATGLNSTGTGGALALSHVQPTSIISDCSFTDNIAKRAGAVSIGNSPGTLRFLRCEFIGNFSDGYGGALDTSGGTVLQIDDCTFIDNTADFRGGAMYSQSNGNHVIRNCLFDGNRAYEQGQGGEGAAVFAATGSSITFDTCVFMNGYSLRGGAVYNDGQVGGPLTPQFMNCAFINNTGLSEGGAIYNIKASPTFHGCHFEGNFSDFGGAVRNQQANPVFEDCVMIANSAYWQGGAMMNSTGAAPTLRRCRIEGNSGGAPGTTGNGGGALFSTESQPKLFDCQIVNNRAERRGGAMYNDRTTMLLENCLLHDNEAKTGGGAIFLRWSSTITLTNCTVAYNRSPVSGGGLTLFNCCPEGQGTITSIANIVNSIFWANTVGPTDNSETAQILKQSATTVILNYSCVQNLTGLLGGVGNIGVNPMFVDPVLDPTLNRNLRLLAGSPCVETGSNPAVPPTMILDLDGNPRIVDGDHSGSVTVDMGAYEFQPPVLLAMDIKPGGCPNMFNLVSNGVLPVAVLGSAEFDVTSINRESIKVSRVDRIGGFAMPNEGPPGPHTTIDDVATPFTGQQCDCHALEGDGFPDLSLKFRSDELVSALDLNSFEVGALVPLMVEGELNDGRLFVAFDCIRLVPPGTPPGLVTIGSSTNGVWLEVTPQDNALDGGGFSSFKRSFPLGTVVHVVAPKRHDEYAFTGWKIDGELQKWRGLTLTIVVIEEETLIEAVFTPTQITEPSWQGSLMPLSGHQ